MIIIKINSIKKYTLSHLTSCYLYMLTITYLFLDTKKNTTRASSSLIFNLIVSVIVEKSLSIVIKLLKGIICKKKIHIIQ